MFDEDMTTQEPHYFDRIAAASDFILGQIEGDIRMATPLGLGKPNQLLNDFYEKIKKDSRRKLTLFTALSLSVPEAKSDLERRFLKPFADRHFGADYPALAYQKDLEHRKLPSHVQIHEFYFQAGQDLGILHAQANYVSLNYTHVARYIMSIDVQVIVQLVAKGTGEFKGKYSLSCNPDLTLDVAELYRESGKKLMMVGVVHPDLPFLPEDAIVNPDFFAAIVESPEVTHQLFALPQYPIDDEDHLIGLHASSLVEDDGTLQIGIGSLSDALVHSLILRHEKNEVYHEIVTDFAEHRGAGAQVIPSSLGLFEKGLYGTSEMIMDGFMYLRQRGILKREVFELNAEKRRYLHGAFFLGTKRFYQWLSNLSEKDFNGLNMTKVSMVNDLYDPHEMAIRRQRKNARFFNSCMNVTLLGGVAADTLENGQVISGVGGQYNFVAMSHELPDAKSVLMLRSTRTKNGKRTSNIIWGHEQITIPRHLRDVVVTEYGIADLRGQSDSEVIKRLLNITDADFQEGLLQTAKHNGKIDPAYEIPEWAKRNTSEKLKGLFSDYQAKGYFPAYPFGSDFTETEQKLYSALMSLQDATHSFSQLLKLLFRGIFADKKAFAEELKRMRLDQCRSIADKLYQKLVLGALASL
jgi:acyl-CoA hydrolase